MIKKIKKSDLFSGKKFKYLSVALLLVLLFAAIFGAYMSSNAVADEILKERQQIEEKIYNNIPVD